MGQIALRNNVARRDKQRRYREHKRTRAAQRYLLKLVGGLQSSALLRLLLH
jgi:hypothetical protein